MADLTIKSIIVSECATNCYLCKNKETGEGFIVDPGDDFAKLNAHILNMQMSPKAILLTHGHYDHFAAAKELTERYGIKVYAARDEDELCRSSRLNLSVMFGANDTIKPDILLDDGQEFDVAGVHVRFILTPGHTPGSGCFYLEDEAILFSGDTLFRASRGRTDFPGGSTSQIIRSIREKLLVLPDETDVFPGHMMMTTIGDEKVFY